jgi:hypothetical protein
MSRPFIDLTGRKFGDLTVISRDVDKQKSTTGHATFWHCRCICGKMTSVRYYGLTHRKGSSNQGTVSCGCIRGRRLHKEYRRDLPAAFGCLVASYKKSARQRGLPYTLTLDEFYDLTKGNCQYCGCEPGQFKTLHSPPTTKYMYPSYTYNGIDRVDSSKGYVQGNVVPCCIHCNRAKRAMSVDEFLAWVDRVYKHIHSYPVAP